jgi:hypothetical protein
MPHTDEKPRQRTRKITIGTIVTTLVLSIFATLVGPLGGLSTASAQDRVPRFKIGEMKSAQYTDFINQIHRQINAADNGVPGSYNTVDHTSDTTEFFDVDVQMWGSEDFVRIRLRRSDLYLVGWWSSDAVYNRVDSEAASGAPAGSRPTNFRADYPSLERVAGASRYEIGFSRDALNTAAWNLYNARQPTDRDGGNQAATEIRNQARAVLMMTQFLSEAARFRGVATRLSFANEERADHDPVYIPWQVAGQENDWGTLSERFNRWLGAARAAGNPQIADPDTHEPTRVWTIDQWNNLVGFTLATLADYARVLYTVKGRP